MKPHLTRRFGVWLCKRRGESNPRGYGYSPKDAYSDWLAECWRAN